jgi:hypothetical protein
MQRVDGQPVDPALAPVVGQDRYRHQFSRLSYTEGALPAALVLLAECGRRVPAFWPRAQASALPQSQYFLIISWTENLHSMDLWLICTHFSSFRRAIVG